ncbi:MAG: hypothetical protein ACXVFN_01285 [Solirubrobacteraceae bacterium]
MPGAGSAPPNANVAALSGVAPDGPDVSVVSGACVSIVNVRDADAETLPAASLAHT